MTGAPPAGSEGEACVAGECLGDLVCLSNRCVRTEPSVEDAGNPPLFDAGETVDAQPPPVSSDGGAVDAGAPAEEPSRVVFVFSPHGQLAEDVVLDDAGGFTFEDTLEPLAPLAPKTVVLNIDIYAPEPAGSMAEYFAGTTLTARIGEGERRFRSAVGPSIERVIGQAQPTPIPSLYLPFLPGDDGLSLNNYPGPISWLGEDMFEQADWTLEDPLAQLRQHAADPDLTSAIDRMATFELISEDLERLALLPQLLALTFQEDLTRSVLVQLGNLLSRLPWLEVGSLSPRDAAHGRRFEPYFQFYATQVAAIAEGLDAVAAIAEGLDAVPAAGGDSLLDHTLIVWLTDTAPRPNSHGRTDLKVFLLGDLGGVMPHGKYIDLGGRYLADLHLTLANLMGSPIESFGDPALEARPIDAFTR